MRFFKILIVVVIVAVHSAYAQKPEHIKVDVVDSTTNRPLRNFNIFINEEPVEVSEGHIDIASFAVPLAIKVSHVGYRTKEYLWMRKLDRLSVLLAFDENAIEEVVINTGYQKLSRERMTGSFETLDQQEINRSVNSNIINRLEDMTTSLSFDKRTYNINNPTHTDGIVDVRGISSINGVNTPLIVLDNFPYEGDIANINPVDIETVTILKDAAATSIWGAQAGNGVIVITTKRGKAGDRQRWGFSSNLTLAERPDLLRLNQAGSADFIDMEMFLYDQGYFNNQINNNRRPALSPVVELLRLQQEGSLDNDEFDDRIAQLKNIDLRKEYLEHFYTTPVNQRYALNLSGGTDRSSYYVSLGYDKNVPPLKGNNYERQTLNIANDIKVSDRFLLNTKLMYNRVSTSTFQDGYGAGNPIYPYAQFADNENRPLPINYGYSMRYLDNLPDIGLLDWKYRPIDELENNDRTSKANEVLADLGLNVKLVKGLSLDIKGQFGYSGNKGRRLYNEQTYYTRNTINLYTDASGETLKYQYPFGAILDLTNNEQHTLSSRGQLNYDRLLGAKHSLSGMVGGEIREVTNTGDGSRFYGYDEDKLLFSPIDQINRYQTYDNLGGRSIIGNNSFFQNASRDRYLSFYTNLSYSYDQKYVAYFSGRRDASNIFGAKTNGKWTPLWSVGGAWNVHNEKFWNSLLLSQLKLRVSYGYSGNVNKTVAALSTISYASNLTTNTRQPFAMIANPPNPELRWERVQTFNFGLDLSLLKNRLAGSLDIYTKKSLDLIGSSPIDPTTGVTNVYINSAHTDGKGMDLSLRSRNLITEFRWNTQLLLSYNKVIIAKYMQEVEPVMSYIQQINRIEGELAYAVFSYKWGGLDPENGNPLGYLNGELSDDWRNILQQLEHEDLNLHGSARPLWFGSLRNDFAYKGFNASINLGFRFKFFFRKPTLHYGQIGTWNPIHGDYKRRWQKPGDEQHTSVYSFLYPNDSYRDNFYQGAEINVVKGDHVRLKDIRLGYTISKLRPRSGSLELFAYLTNLGFLWRANKEGIDPDTPQNEIGLPKTFSFGINLSI
ncbi:SusC/RagA family TonB-linked outer membrane protein [Sphingobacterium haloxyli]|uniref:TonB-dependent receptor plug domain-containing protein n=1 Tax=Sphingobacterium haloxyli TaxID=2100533 RepID=A0A2S9J4H0_9SPHI|nr:SusC/RagA family TonB-linked outer membrane protein [Sphingobacterium haloxyli]PRD47629.1 hypothetical protein C5745_09995 [Sphingobacterium haloxyli]